MAGNKESARGKTIRILLVDDTAAVRRILGAMLRIDGGFEVATAAGGAEALDILSKSTYDIVLVDINMPVMDGIELYRKIEKQFPDVATRVVFMSADNQPPQVFKKVNRPFLAKPFTTEALMNAYRSGDHREGSEQ
ncbi:MAG: response regulator [Candidatus Omnitrophica bacterium]|jgi:CheY-like chemotaxis protein|nr:response regulator [Candidatus Omnitrophota bacterium]